MFTIDFTLSPTVVPDGPIGGFNEPAAGPHGPHDLSLPQTGGPQPTGRVPPHPSYSNPDV